MAKERARQLRKTMTHQEVKLWVHLRTWRSRGFHFRRQVPRDPYIVDFACLRHKLIIEVDGSQHGMPIGLAKDQRRDAHLNAQGFRVLRVWNNEIDQNLTGVLQMIESLLESEPHSGPSGRPSPSGGGMGN